MKKLTSRLKTTLQNTFICSMWFFSYPEWDIHTSGKTQHLWRKVPALVSPCFLAALDGIRKNPVEWTKCNRQAGCWHGVPDATAIVWVKKFRWCGTLQLGKDAFERSAKGCCAAAHCQFVLLTDLWKCPSLSTWMNRIKRWSVTSVYSTFLCRLSGKWLGKDLFWSSEGMQLFGAGKGKRIFPAFIYVR